MGERVNAHPFFVMRTLLAIIVLCGLCGAQNKPLVWASANVGLAVADYETALAFHHAPRMPSDTWCYENNSFYGSRLPSRADFYLRGLALDAGVQTFGAVLRRCKHHWYHKFWWMPFAWVTQAHTTGLVQNLRCK